MRGNTVIVTGGFGVLGSAVAAAAADRGARLCVIDQASHAPEGLEAALNAGALLLGGVDLTDPDIARDAVEKAKMAHGSIDALINVAGTFRWETLQDGDAATWDLLYQVNVKTAVNTSKAVLPYLLEQGAGRIVNIGANAALKSGGGMGPYAASKSGVHRLTESLAEELKGTGITVNAILPSIIDTAANRADMPDADFSQWVTPVDLGEVIMFLISENARSITGALLPVTGGL